MRSTVRQDVRGYWPDSDISLRACADGWAWVVGDTGKNGNVVSGYYRVQGKRWVNQYSWAKLFTYCAPNPSITGNAKFKKAVLKKAPACKAGEYIA